MKEKSFIPFGFQYYRSPTPYRDQWAMDLERISLNGFNCIKLWVQWRDCHPSENTFIFDDIADLMDLAESHRLKVVLNVIFDVAPVWFYKKYPNSLMETADGTVLKPQALSYRQIGGAPGPCYHHEPAQREKDRFLMEAVKKLGGHSALWVWDLWNEPELTTGIKRKLAFENQVCYCDHSLQAFAVWLHKKYESIDALNLKWQRRYGDWSEVEPPRGQAIYNDMVDWRLFMSDALTEDLKRRIQVVKALDTEHPVMVHTVPSPIFNLITAGSDDFMLAEPCDLFGNSLGSSAWSADLLLSAAGGKPVINSEIHALPGTTALKPRKLNWTELKRHVLIPLSRGILGYLFWQYRPETLGHEAPAWGSTYMDGSETPWLKEMAALNSTIQLHGDRLTESTRPSDGIAILFSSENQIANFAAYAHLDTYNDSVQGMHHLLHDLNYKVEFVHDRLLNKETLARFRCLWMPYPLYLNRDLCKIIREWVANGGILLAENSFGALQAEDGTHSPIVPGYGFDEIFGVRETWIHSVEHLDHSYHEVIAESRIAIPIASLTASGTSDVTLEGSYYKTDITVRSDVDVLAAFAEDGMAAITCADYGRGKAVWIGSLLAAAYERNPLNGTRTFFRELLQTKFGLTPYVTIEGEDGVRGDVLSWEAEGTSGCFVFASNWSDSDREVRIRLPKPYSAAACWFADGEGTLESSGGAESCLRVRLAPGDIQVFTMCAGIEE
ncbi:beta-galactosidase [Paenibacillus sp. CF384]|uniref:beta-galactosidase n=1 Tax=Paenibacillus sp. CF384 TaxID=1884382 RepID=UPI0008970409|nr:beta-galactosidase [Paenibacillus sp. CF384]SDW14467.1 beta-galactosidase [Paenibacillus sp. CF384]